MNVSILFHHFKLVQAPQKSPTHVMVLLIRIREMAIHGWWPDRSDSQLALLRHRFPRVCYSTDQITMGRVRKP